MNKKIVQLKQGDRVLDISIFPNGKLYDMNGESFSDEWEVLQICMGWLKRENWGFLRRVYNFNNLFYFKTI